MSEVIGRIVAMELGLLIAVGIRNGVFLGEHLSKAR